MLRPLSLLAVLSSFSLAACSVGSGEAPQEDPAEEANDVGDGPRQPDDDAPDVDDAPPSGDYSQGVNVGIAASGAPVCSGDLAQDTFRYGLCVCHDLAMAGALYTSSFHSSDGAAAVEGEGGGVGVNGRFASSGDADIGGSLVVGGEVTPVGDYTVAGELRAGGDANLIGDIDVEEDAYVQGRVLAIGLTVGGTLHTTEALGFSWVEAGATVVEQFAIAPPCGCDDVIDIAGFVAAAAQANDNAAAGLSEDVLAGAVGEVTLALPPGRYYLSSIRAAGDVEFHLTGPTAVYVGGDVELAGELEAVLETDAAELDLFVDGSLAHAGHLELGSDEAPARVRTYVGGDGDIAMAGDMELGGALYAPHARVSVAGDLSLSGALLVGELADAGRLTVRYDADLQEAGEGCEPDDDGDGSDDGSDGAGNDGSASDDGAPAGEADPNAPTSCESFMDCPDPQQCVNGSCIFVDG